MTFLVILLLFAQFEPDSRLNIARIQERQKLQGDLTQAILSSDIVLVESVLKQDCNPNFQINLSESELNAVKALSPRMYHYCRNGWDFQPLHLAAGLGETAICRLLIANGAKQY